MSEAVIGTLLGVTLGAVLGWGLLEITGFLRRRRQDTKTLKRFLVELEGITTRIKTANSPLATQSPAHQEIIETLVEQTPNIGMFDEVFTILPDKEMEFAAPVIHVWNALRKVDPSVVPDDRDLDKLRKLILCHILLRRPFAYIRYPKESKSLRSLIRQILTKEETHDLARK
jgi:hypothetical protein